MNLWQPSIDRWIIKESDLSSPSTTNASMNSNDSSRQSHLFGADLMSGGVPVKSEEEEDVFDKLSTPYKGIKTFSELKRKIHETVESVFSLSKIEDDNRVVSNPYGAIQTILDSPDFKAMLDVASNEIKKRFVSI
jgi:hypothetical protein